jgi:Uma2 family endonuclease
MRIASLAGIGVFATGGIGGVHRGDGMDVSADLTELAATDVLVVCDASKTDRRGVRGAPDLAVEVLSPSTASHDQVRKLRVYERAGVREYWLVHPIDRVLTIYRLEKGQYGKPDVFELRGQTSVGVLKDVVIHWDQLLERLPAVEP